MMFYKFGVKYLINQSCSATCHTESVCAQARTGAPWENARADLSRTFHVLHHGKRWNSISHTGEFRALVLGTWRFTALWGGGCPGRATVYAVISIALCESRWRTFHALETGCFHCGPGQRRGGRCVCVCVFGNICIKYFRVDIDCFQGRDTKYLKTLL